VKEKEMEERTKIKPHARGGFAKLSGLGRLQIEMLAW
jgi:hypothetical protein